jgi:hypothetical protein
MEAETFWGLSGLRPGRITQAATRKVRVLVHVAAAGDPEVGAFEQRRRCARQ